jgi:hypothetical protein
MMKRFPDWPKRLNAHLETVRDKPFAWGEHDCALAAAGAIQAMTGVDIAAPLRGKYSSAGTAVVAMRDFAGGSLEQVIEKIAQDRKMPEIKSKMAQRGDLVLLDGELLRFEDDQGAAVAIVGMNGAVAHAVGPKGAVVIPLAAWHRAWRV